MVKVGDIMIDIKKLLSSPHITVRRYWIFTFHNKCGYGHCRHETCKNCCHTNYHIHVRNSSHEYRLPNWMQRILRKILN